MTKKHITVIGIILLVFGFALWMLLPLQSTAELVYQAQYSDNATSEEKAAIMSEALLAIQQSIDASTTEGTTEDGIFLVSVEVSPWSAPVPEPPETTAAPPAGNAEDILGGSEQEPGALLQVRVRVAWRGAVGERSIERVTYVLDYERIGQLGSPLPAGLGEEES